MTISLGPVLHPAHCISELKTRKRESVLQELARHAQGAGVVRGVDVLQAALSLRERLCASAVGRGVAVPNARSLAVLEQRVLIARSHRGIDWGAQDGEPVRLVLLVLSPAELGASSHHDLLARAVASTRPARVRQRLLEAQGTAELAVLLREALA